MLCTGWHFEHVELEGRAERGRSGRFDAVHRLARAAGDVGDEQADLGRDRADGGIDTSPRSRRRRQGRADAQPADQPPAIGGERDLSPRENAASGDDNDELARFAGPDREQLDVSGSVQPLVEHRRADLGEEGRVEMGARLRAGHGQMRRRGDEPPELAPAGVPGGITTLAGSAGAGAPGELHAAAKSTTAAISTARNGPAEQPRLPLLRLQTPGIHFPPAPASTLYGGHRTTPGEN